MSRQCGSVSLQDTLYSCLLLGFQCPVNEARRHFRTHFTVGYFWDFNVPSMWHGVTSGHTLQLVTSGILESRQRGTTRTHFDFTETVARTQQMKH